MLSFRSKQNTKAKDLTVKMHRYYKPVIIIQCKNKQKLEQSKVFCSIINSAMMQSGPFLLSAQSWKITIIKMFY
jgi:hypothetical protein